MEPPRDDWADGVLTWSALLAHWTRLARASLALPASAEGERWRRAVPAIVGLQAVACALRQAERLPTAERAVARDRAAVLIERYARQLATLWGGSALHPELVAFIEDARTVLRRLEAASEG